MRRRRKAFTVGNYRIGFKYPYPTFPKSAQRNQPVKAKKKTASESQKDYYKSVAEKAASKAPLRRKRSRPSVVGKKYVQLPGKRVPGGRMGGKFKTTPQSAFGKMYTFINKRGRAGGRVSRTTKLVTLSSQAVMPKNSKNIKEKVNNMVIRNAKTAGVAEGVLDAGIKLNRRRNPVVPMRVMPTVVREPSPMTAPVSPNSYKIKIETGFKPGKAVRMLRTVAGEVTKELENTERQDQGGSPRNVLTQSFGFNQRLFYAHNGSTVTRDQILDLIQESGQPPTSSSTLAQISDKFDYYANVTKIRQSMKIVNENEYFPVKVKVHLVAPKTNWFPTNNPLAIIPLAADATPNRAIQGSFQDIANPTSNNGGTVPYWTQVTDVTQGSNVATVNGTKECNIKDSDAFNQNYKIIRTFNRTLDPNDVIYLNHEHCYRTGVYINQLYKASVLQSDAQSRTDSNPLFSFFLVEAVGTTASLVNTTGTENNHIGTGIGKLSFEHRTAVSYIPEMQNALSNGAGTNIAVPVSLRTFAAVPASKDRVFNQSHADVIAGTDWSLVATTRTQRQREGAGI